MSDLSIHASKAREKPYKLSDERGLYKLINPNGSRWWRFRIYFDQWSQLRHQHEGLLHRQAASPASDAGTET